MTWCYGARGPKYHWILDLYERVKLPILPPVVNALEKATKERAAALAKQKTEAAKQGRVKMKAARAEDQVSRKKWLQRQAVQHTYGNDEDDDNDDNEEVEHGTEAGEQSFTVVSGRRCRCGAASCAAQSW